MLNTEESNRYSRQMILPEIGISGQLRLKSAKVLVVGAGGLGCPILQYLTAAGVGEIGIIDDDVVEVTNLHRQILYTAADVGKAKVLVAKAKLEQLNPLVKLRTYQERLTAKNAIRILDPYQIVIDGSDNFKTRYAVNDACVKLKKSLVFGSILRFEGHISVFNHSDGPDYSALFPEQPSPASVPNCSEVGVLNILPGIVGMYMANEVIKIVCKIGETLSGTLMTINILNNTTSYFKIPGQKRATATPIYSDPDSIAEIDRPTLDQWLKGSEKPLALIDVREVYEFEEYNIGGINLPLYELNEQIDFLLAHKTIVFVCQTGQKSKMAIQLMKSRHDGSLYSLKNGIQ